jgi:hypothetical protein
MTNYEKRAIFNFKVEIEKTGSMDGLPGRNKSSAEVPSDDKAYQAKVNHATKFKLWHYHIGLPVYDETKAYGDYTSRYVLDYIRVDENRIIKMVRLAPHDEKTPYTLPGEARFEHLIGWIERTASKM